jgi:hypothetical protein
MDKPLIWIHDDALGAEQPVFRRHRHAQAVYIFDDSLIAYRQYGLKRLGFIAECLADLDVSIYRGNTGDVLAWLCDQSGTDTVSFMQSPCPKIKAIARGLKQDYGLKLDPVANTPLVRLLEKPDLRRFSRYWRQAQKTAFNQADLPLFKRPIP